MLEILRTNSNLKSTLNRHLKKLHLKLHLLRVKNQSLLSKSQRNLKLLLLKNITRTRELRSITLSKRRLPEDQKSMLNGSKKKNWPSLNLRRIRKIARETLKIMLNSTPVKLVLMKTLNLSVFLPKNNNVSLKRNVIISTNIKVKERKREL